MHAGTPTAPATSAACWPSSGLTAAFLVVEAAVGLWTGSLSLLADAAHMLVDAGGVLLSLLAVWFAERPATPDKTYGYYRVEILAALVNGVVLCVIAIAILVAGLRAALAAAARAGRPDPRGGRAGARREPGLHAAAARAAPRESLNVRGAYLEVLGDAVSSGRVIVAGAVIVFTGWTRRRRHRGRGSSRSSSCRARGPCCARP